MSDEPNTKAAKGKAVDDAAERKAAALRANLAKRKQQAGARRGGKAVGKTESSAFDALLPRDEKDG